MINKKLGILPVKNSDIYKSAFIIFYILFIILNVLIAPAYFALANWEQQIQDMAKGKAGSPGSPISSPDDVLKILNNALKYMYTAFFIVAIIFLLRAAYKFLQARADPAEAKNARISVYWALVAIGVALVSVGAAQIIDTFLRESAKL